MGTFNLITSRAVFKCESLPSTLNQEPLFFGGVRFLFG